MLNMGSQPVLPSVCPKKAPEQLSVGGILGRLVTHAGADMFPGTIAFLLFMDSDFTYVKSVSVPMLKNVPVDRKISVILRATDLQNSFWIDALQHSLCSISDKSAHATDMPCDAQSPTCAHSAPLHNKGCKSPICVVMLAGGLLDAAEPETRDAGAR